MLCRVWAQAQARPEVRPSRAQGRAQDFGRAATQAQARPRLPGSVWDRPTEFGCENTTSNLIVIGHFWVSLLEKSYNSFSPLTRD
jgi:hypothetical protein